ncbi:MAG: response regulator transcription factor [Bacteroidales bacterium]|jgi:NarL family two-component system response regulator LiaR|nr:response regulator transcription factor [Bacteroidales bacterium]
MTTTTEYKILLVDDHPLIRSGVKITLEKNFKYIDEAENGEEAINKLKETAYDLVILDIDMPVIDGIEVAKYIKQNELMCKIVFLTSHTNFSTFSEALNTDYNGFLFKESAINEITNCINTVFSGEKYIGSQCKKYIDANEERIKSNQETKEKLTQLTKTEIKILKQISMRKTTPQIADELFNSIKTIENHRYNICNKLDISGSNNLLSFAISNKKIIDDL